MQEQLSVTFQIAPSGPSRGPKAHIQAVVTCEYVGGVGAADAYRVTGTPWAFGGGPSLAATGDTPHAAVLNWVAACVRSQAAAPAAG